MSVFGSRRKALRAEVVKLAIWVEADSSLALHCDAMSSKALATGFWAEADGINADAAFYRREAERNAVEAFRVARAFA